MSRFQQTIQQLLLRKLEIERVLKAMEADKLDNTMLYAVFKAEYESVWAMLESVEMFDRPKARIA